VGGAAGDQGRDGFLHGHGISTHLAVKIYKQYGDQSLAVVQATPYRLVQDIHGIGFKTADKIAQALGLPFDDPARVEAGIHYTLKRWPTTATSTRRRPSWSRKRPTSCNCPPRK
jgi:ATP-dependent exoDNAse (exonuclease V) alpha subunit